MTLRLYSAAHNVLHCLKHETALIEIWALFALFLRHDEPMIFGLFFALFFFHFLPFRNPLNDSLPVYETNATAKLIAISRTTTFTNGTATIDVSDVGSRFYAFAMCDIGSAGNVRESAVSGTTLSLTAKDWNGANLNSSNVTVRGFVIGR